MTCVGYDKNNNAKFVVIILSVKSNPRVPCSLNEIGLLFSFFIADRALPKIAHNKPESQTNNEGNLN